MIDAGSFDEAEQALESNIIYTLAMMSAGEMGPFTATYLTALLYHKLGWALFSYWENHKNQNIIPRSTRCFEKACELNLEAGKHLENKAMINDLQASIYFGLGRNALVLDMKKQSIRYFRQCVSIDLPSNATSAPCQKIAREGLGKMSDDCFIATATTGSTASWQVRVLRQFRDTVLLQFQWGQQGVQWYTHWSPPIAEHLRGNPTQRRIIGWLISAISIVIIPIGWIVRMILSRR